MGAEEKKEKTKIVPGTQSKARAGWQKKRKKQKLFLVLSPRPGQDGPNASGWYRRLREPISPLSLLNCDQLWQLFVWTILLTTVIHDLDSRITAKCSKCPTSFYSMQVSFRFHSLRCSKILVSPSICTKIRTCRFHRTEEVSNNFSVSWHIIHISRVWEPWQGGYSGRFHLIISGNQKTEFRNPRLNSRPSLPFNQSGFDRIGGAVKNNGSHQQVL